MEYKFSFYSKKQKISETKMFIMKGYNKVFEFLSGYSEEAQASKNLLTAFEKRAILCL